MLLDNAEIYRSTSSLPGLADCAKRLWMISAPVLEDHPRDVSCATLLQNFLCDLSVSSLRDLVVDSFLETYMGTRLEKSRRGAFRIWFRTVFDNHIMSSGDFFEDYLEELPLWTRTHFGDAIREVARWTLFNYTSVALTRTLKISVGIFILGSFAWDHVLGKFAGDFSFGNFRLRYFVWALSLG